MAMDQNADVFLGLHDFLGRMRQPSAAEFVRSIKSFIVSFSNNSPEPERDSALVQEFFGKMESSFRVHPLWAGCSEEELDAAGEGLEKYVMTKLFPRVFATAPDDVKADEDLTYKISLVQQFIAPENLDIKPSCINETSWLLAQKELQKINMYKSPRDKLICILSCCKVINNLLLNASITSNEDPPGADEFLPALIYVTIKANPPNLRSNLMYIQRYRRQSKLVAESGYFLTNMLSVDAFILNIDAKSLSMEEHEFEKHMELSRALLSGLSGDVDDLSSQLNKTSGLNSKEEFEREDHIPDRQTSDQAKSLDALHSTKTQQPAEDLSLPKIQSLSDLQNRGASALLIGDSASQVLREYPYLFANVGDLTLGDIEDLLNNYKQLVFKYVCLSKGLGGNPTTVSTQRKEPSPFSEVDLTKNYSEAEESGTHYESTERTSLV